MSRPPFSHLPFFTSTPPEWTESSGTLWDAVGSETQTTSRDGGNHRGANVVTKKGQHDRFPIMKVKYSLINRAIKQTSSVRPCRRSSGSSGVFCYQVWSWTGDDGDLNRERGANTLERMEESHRRQGGWRWVAPPIIPLHFAWTSSEQKKGDVCVIQAPLVPLHICSGFRSRLPALPSFSLNILEQTRERDGVFDTPLLVPHFIQTPPQKKVTHRGQSLEPLEQRHQHPNPSNNTTTKGRNLPA